MTNVHHEKDESGIEPWTGCGNFKCEKGRIYRTTEGFRMNIWSHFMIDDFGGLNIFLYKKRKGRKKKSVGRVGLADGGDQNRCDSSVK
jgi:hypothetical protein